MAWSTLQCTRPINLTSTACDLPVAQDTSHHEERSYGLVLALQVSLPIVAVHAVQSLNAEFPDHAQPLFQFCLSEVQYTLAAEDSLQDVRWAALDSIADMIFIYGLYD